MVWEPEVLQGFYGAKTESDLIKTQNSQVINEQKNLMQVHIKTSSCEQEWEPILG